MKDIIEQLVLHEGLKKFPYKDTVGKLTIGVGRNLDDKGITTEEAKYLLKNDIRQLEKQLIEYDWFKNLSRVRKKIIVDMAFNLGLNGLFSFENMITEIKNNNYREAAEEMLDSKWSEQVGTRATRLAEMMRSGRDYDVE